MTLDKFKPGMTACLIDIDPTHLMRRRLMELGLTPGTCVSVLRTAPLGDPIELRVRGYRLSLRKKDAALINCQAA